MYRSALEPSPVETSGTGLPMPTFFGLLQDAWPTTRWMWLGAASLAVVCVGFAIATGMVGLAFLGVLCAVVVGAAAIESTFDAWLSWVPDLSTVYSTRELTLWFGAGLLGALVLAMGLIVALVLALPEEIGGRILMEAGPKLVLLLVASVLYGVRTTLRWRYAARVMRTRVVSDYV